MTIHRHQQLPNYASPSSGSVEDDNNALSPSDGYFGQRDTVPNTVFVENPQSTQRPADDKTASTNGKDGPKKIGATFTPSDDRSAGAYTPNTAATPMTSSEYAGSNHTAPSIADDDPPPQYSPTPAGSSSSNPSIAGNYRQNMSTASRQVDHTNLRHGQSGQYYSTNIPGGMNGQRPYTDAQPPPAELGASGYPQHGLQSDPSANYRDDGTIPSGQYPNPPTVRTSFSPSPQNNNIPPFKSGCIAPGSGNPFLGWRRQRRGCCGRHERSRDNRGRCRHIKGLIGVIVLIWLIVHLSLQHHQLHQRPTHGNVPQHMPNSSFGRQPVPKRSYTQYETSNSIHSNFNLYDLLDLRTVSGSISVTIAPQPADPANPNVPAVLRLKTTSGSVNVHFTRTAPFPQRQFIIEISTQSGTVNGELMLDVAFGGRCAVSTRSGSINTDFYPVADSRGVGNLTSTLSTTSTSGSQNINVHESEPWGVALTTLSAEHVSQGSGGLRIRYPKDWEGIVKARSGGSGSVHVNGYGLQYEQRGSREVVAWRGVGEDMRTVRIEGKGSGTCGFDC